MSASIGWGLAGLALVIGYVGYGWTGLVLAATLVVFWLLLQFNRALRGLRGAAARPVGTVDNAVMLHARLQRGMRLAQILRLTRSLGRSLADEPETLVWTDGGGDRVEVVLRAGRCVAFELRRAGSRA